MTKNRKLILDLINGSNDHLTAEEIYNTVNMPKKVMSKATVYNNLNALCDEKMILRLCYAGQPERYDKRRRHDHAICSVCGKVTDVFLEDMIEDFNRKSDMKFDGYELTLYHVCDTCKAEVK